MATVGTRSTSDGNNQTAGRAEDMFERYRLSADWRLLPLIVYFPVGVVLLVLRLFLSMQLFIIATILPKSSRIRRLALRGSSFVLGLFVTVEGQEKRNDNCNVVVCNHVSVMDHCALETVLPAYQATQLSQQTTVSWFWSGKTFGVSDRHEDVLDRVTEYCQTEGSTPLLFFPESTITNGRVGILKFSCQAFKIGVPIQPVSVMIHKPSFLPIAVSTVDSSRLADFLWGLFSPVSVYHIKILPVIEPVSGDIPENFAEKTQIVIADSVQLKATQFQLRDKLDIISQVHGLLSTRSDSRLVGMVKQVKEVLPHVPNDVIQRDLQRTRCVDTTISNIVEGTIQFSPEAVPSSAQSRLPSSPVKAIASDRKKLGSLQPKPAPYRPLSLKERKKAFIEDARRRYLEKHGASQDR
ncbi:lipid droplet-regulating VLDL assembly factor AUP1-like [Corticium candelabrum]|uniref:lipid droplet-regulating VLDL assembly factor AUP1-like n=1 Tax=Corticium candelabrum TaxID=121492 RepID=UPI002E256F44|nr:lipid droplet-regulating VLDL assembly factor AUP1-like [Corticium candelabrum]